MSTHAVKVKALSKCYGSHTALDNISLTIPPHCIVAILGQNGAGKTSFINSVLGLHGCQAEHISILGQPVHGQVRPAALRNKMGVMMQMGNLNAHLTVAEQLDLFCSYYSQGYTPEELMALCNLHSIQHQRFGRLSGGQRQLVLFAIALISKPQLLFLDEPSAGMDIEVRQQLWQHIRTLRDNGCSIVLTTHYIEEAERLADRIVMLHQGSVLADDTLAEFTAQHTSLEQTYLHLIQSETAHA